MSALGNGVLQTSNAPGTGTVNLIAPPPSFLSFIQACGPGQVFYFIFDGASREWGVGTVTSGSPDTLSRDTVLGNSLGTTAKINFSGAVTLFNEIPAERSMWANAAGDAWMGANRKLSSLAAGVAVDDAVRRDQVGWQQIGQRITIGVTSGYSSGVVNIGFVLPAGLGRFSIEYENVVPTNDGSTLICRVSPDGTNYISGNGSYMQQGMTIAGSSLGAFQGDFAFISMCANLPSGANTSARAMGRIAMAAKSDHGYETFSRGLYVNGGTTTWQSQVTNGRIPSTLDQEFRSVLIGMTGGMASGTFRLLGAF